MTPLEYWKETLAIAAEECALVLTDEQLTALAEAAQGSHENYGMAFYSPPSTDRLSEIEDGWRKKVKQAEAEAERYRSDFVKNVCMRHRVDPSHVILEGDGNVSINH
jgi:hypothetical protein